MSFARPHPPWPAQSSRPDHPDSSGLHARITWPDVGVLALGLGYAVFLTKFGGMGAREAAITATLTVAAIISVRSISRGILALTAQLRGINAALAEISEAAAPATSTGTPPLGSGRAG